MNDCSDVLSDWSVPLRNEVEMESVNENCTESGILSERERGRENRRLNASGNTCDWVNDLSEHAGTCARVARLVGWRRSLAVQ